MLIGPGRSQSADWSILNPTNCLDSFGGLKKEKSISRSSENPNGSLNRFLTLNFWPVS